MMEPISHPSTILPVTIDIQTLDCEVAQKPLVQEQVDEETSAESSIVLQTGEQCPLDAAATHAEVPLLDASDATADITPPFCSSITSNGVDNIVYGSIALFSPWFPAVNPLDKRAQTFSHFRKRRTVTLWMCFAIMFTSFAINLVFTVLALVKLSGFNPSTGIIYSGDCSKVSRLDAAIHAAINILSTLLLAASNLGLQLIVSPTREEINKAHSEGSWLDIGVPSLRNLKVKSFISRFVWFCLIISSMPIHAFYNSMVFASLSSNVFLYALVSSDYISMPLWSNETVATTNPVQPGTSLSDGELWLRHSVTILRRDMLENPSNYYNATNYDCVKSSLDLLKWHPNIILVLKADQSQLPQADATDVTVYRLGFDIPSAQLTPTEGLCDITANLDFSRDVASKETLQKATDPWHISFGINGSTVNFEVEYCILSLEGVGYDHQKGTRAATESCHLQCVPYIMLIVVVCNGIKCLCILWIIIYMKESLVTVGDAVASFLQNENLTTRNLGVTSRLIIEKTKRKIWNDVQQETVPWQNRSLPWKQAASKRRWIYVNSTIFVVSISGLFAMSNGLVTLARYRKLSLSYLWSLGFGRVNSQEIMVWHQDAHGVSGVFTNILMDGADRIEVSGTR